MIGLKLWAEICVGVGFSAILIYFVVTWWLRSRQKPARSFNDLMHKALVETGPHASQSPHIENSENGCVFFANGTNDDGTLNEKNTTHVVGNEAPLRAYNLDKADKEYKGRHFVKAQQAAIGEEVRRKLANRGGSLTCKKDEEGCHPSKTEDAFQKESRLPNVFDKDQNASGSARSEDSSVSALSSKTGVSVPQSSEMSWGHCYTQQELKEATNSFSDANVLGKGGHGIVYHGRLPDGTHIVLKNLSNTRGQAEKEFEIEVEAIGRVRHKNLVRLIGYCMEGCQRMLVYEYIDNGNLEQWLHGPLGGRSPLSWDTRMKIILGTAQGLAYLHEGLEPKVVHRDVKSSNILLDSQWNAKVSDFGFAKLLRAGNSHVTTRVMGTFGYVAPEYVSTGMLTEKSDVFSYGVLVMELITGRVPVDRNRPAGEVNLVDWLKLMVGSRRSEEVADPKMVVKPSSRSLKRALLVALRCVDPDASKRPKMGHVVHMLETADDNPLCQEPRITEEYTERRNDKQMPTILQKHKFFTKPAFILAQKSNHAEKLGQTNVADDGGFVGIVDIKATWKYER